MSFRIEERRRDGRTARDEDGRVADGENHVSYPHRDHA